MHRKVHKKYETQNALKSVPQNVINPQPKKCFYLIAIFFLSWIQKPLWSSIKIHFTKGHFLLFQEMTPQNIAPQKLHTNSAP